MKTSSTVSLRFALSLTQSAYKRLTSAIARSSVPFSKSGCRPRLLQTPQTLLTCTPATVFVLNLHHFFSYPMSRIFLYRLMQRSWTSVRADFDRTTAQDTWVNLTTDFSSVYQLEIAFQEARREAKDYYYMYSESDKALTAARASSDKLTTEVQQLCASLQDLYDTQKSHERFS